MLKLLLPLALSLGFLGLAGCQSEDHASVRAAEIAQMPGLKLTIAGVDLPQDKVHAIAKHVEGQAVDTGAAMVRMKHDDQGGGVKLEIELFAKTLPAQDALVAGLKATFPELAAASIAVDAASGAELGPLPVVEVSDALSPAEAQLEIVEQLQAQGVDGDIKVEVKDEGEGRRIEVKVEKEAPAN